MFKLLTDAVLWPIVLAALSYHFGFLLMRREWETPSANVFRTWVAYTLYIAGTVFLIGGIVRLFQAAD